MKQESSVGGDVRESIEAVSTPMRARVAAGAPNTVAQHYQPFDSEDGSDDESEWEGFDD